VWDEASRRVTGLEVTPTAELGRPRVDVVLRISGFFRDAFPHVVASMDDAVQLVAGLGGEAEAANRHAKSGFQAGKRRQSVEEMERLHSAVRRAAKKLASEEWSRKAPVVYGAGQDPYPTSPEEIVGWLRDHYREHVQQSAELVEEWRASTGAG